MTDILILTERVKNTIQLGESHFREFKSAYTGRPGQKKPGSAKELCRYIGEALVAFANADGGELLIGVEDNGRITGVPHREELIEQMLSASQTHVHSQAPLPLLFATTLTIDEQCLLFFSVTKGSTEIYQLPDGRCVRRQDKSTVPATFKEIRFERQEVVSREYDRQFVDGATVSDLDINALQPLANEYLQGLSVEGYLQQIGLAEYAANGLRLRRAALLLFARDVNRWQPHSFVRILKVSGTELKSGTDYNVISDEIVRGNILTLLLSSWTQLRPYLAYKTELSTDARFEQHYLYPEWACREALINAIAHRDYSRHTGIEIFLFDNRMEIKSPGPLLSTIRVSELEELQGAHESRNVHVTTVLRENKYMRELGEGMKRIFQLMDEHALGKPMLFSNTNWFSITLPQREI
ncbi:MAG: ATP-binding protein [Chloroflexota bacterium]